MGKKKRKRKVRSLNLRNLTKNQYSTWARAPTYVFHPRFGVKRKDEFLMDYLFIYVQSEIGNEMLQEFSEWPYFSNRLQKRSPTQFAE